jgi:hypothetical protein
MCLFIQNIELDILSNGGKKTLELHHVVLCFPHEHNEVGVSLSDLWLGHICIKKDHKPWDGGGPIWCRMLKKK